MVHKALLILVFISGWMTALAQKPWLYFNRISTQNGLSHNKVNCFLQDKRGFLWIGTDDGLNRYDGSYFTVFRNQPGNGSSLSGNIITALFQDKDEVMWVATADGGLTRYDYRLPAKAQFKQFKHIEGDSSTIPVNIINALVEDQYGYLWLATSGATVIRFDKKKERFLSVVNEGTKTVLTMCIDAKGILWAGRQGGSFVKVNTHNLSYEMDRRYFNLYADLPHVTITALHRDTDHNIWYGSWDKVLFRYNASTSQEEVIRQTAAPFSFPNDVVLTFAADTAGRLWMGGRDYGLTIYDKKQQKFFNYQYDPALQGTIADNHINCIYIDREGHVWIGTNKGISIFDPSQQLYEQVFLPRQNRDITINDFYKDDKGCLWIGTSEGIFRKETGKDHFRLKKIMYKGKPMAVSKFFRDDDGTLYIGTSYSLFVYDSVTDQVSILPNTDKDRVMNGIINSKVASVVKDTIDGHPVLLVSPYGHFMAYYDLKVKHWISRTDTVRNIVTAFNLKDNLIRKFYKCANGQIWVATAKEGIGKWLKKSPPYVEYLTTNPLNKTAITNDNVFDILEDQKGNLWISTFGGGVNYYNCAEHTFSHASATANLCEGIETDKHGDLWIISNGNLNKYQPGININTSFILPDYEKSGGVKGYIYKDKEGIMYLAGMNYFIEFNPDAINIQSNHPAPYLTNFQIFSKSFPELLQQKRIELRYFQNYFTIEFAAPDFTGNKTEYSYRLENFENDWTDAGNRNFANYSNLPAGKYVFTVRASNKKGYWGEEIAAVSITIIPPFWKQWWFFVLCALAVLSAVWAFYRYRINELIKRQAIRNKIAQDLHDSLGSTLSSISIYTKVARVYQQQHKAEELSGILEKITITASDMISDMSDIVWSLKPSNDNMEKILQKMDAFAKPLCKAKDIDFQLEFNHTVFNINLPMDVRKNFYLIYKEAINNAVKYAQASVISVHIYQAAQSLNMVYKDNGIGFELKKANQGNGLQNMQRRTEEMKGVIVISSKPGTGTTISISLPIP